MSEQIKGKVAQVLDSRRLVLNRGAADGVEVGSRFAVLSSKTVAVTDPDDPDRVLGTLPVARTVVKVVSVEDHMAIAQTFRTLKSTGILPTFTLGPSQRDDSIYSDDMTVVEKLGTAERTVKLGDIAIEVPGDDEFEGIVLPF